MVVVAQLVRALDCGSRGRRFETGLPPFKTLREIEGVFLFKTVLTSRFFTLYLPIIHIN